MDGSVSVVMPVYNGARFIARAIDSVLAQAAPPAELIVIDDGSVDATADIVAAYGNSVRYERQENAGPSAARNRALQLAIGTFIAFLDSDDEWEPEFLSATVSRLVALDDRFVGVRTGWQYEDAFGHPLADSIHRPPPITSIRGLLRASMFPGSVVVRRATLMSVGGFDSSIYAMEDWDAWLRLTVTGGVFAGIPDCLSRYRLHGPSQSGDVDFMRNGRMAALEKLFGRTDLPPEIRALENYARAWALLESSAALYGEGRTVDAQSDFVESAKLDSSLLDEADVYFALICADQPIGYKATRYPFDISSAEERVANALAALPANLGPRGSAHAAAYAALARMAATQGLTGRTAWYMCQSIRHRPRGDDVAVLGRAVLGSLRRRALSAIGRRAVVEAVRS